MLAQLKEKADALKSSGQETEAAQIYGLVEAMSQMKAKNPYHDLHSRSWSRLVGGSTNFAMLFILFIPGQSCRHQNQGGGHR